MNPSKRAPFSESPRPEKDPRFSPFSLMDTAGGSRGPRPRNGVRRGTQAGRRIKITPFKKMPVIGSTFLDRCWEQKLKPAVDSLFARRALQFSPEELYHAVDDCCMQKSGPRLYKNLRAVVGKEVSRRVGELARDHGDPNVWLVRVDNAWKRHCDEIILLRGIFLELDRKYMLRSDEREKSVWDMALVLWQTSLESEYHIEEKLVRTLIDKINEERKGGVLDETRMRSLFRMLHSTSMYDTRFTMQFINDSLRFYTLEAEHRIANDDIPTYLAHVAMRLREEEQRLIRYLDTGAKCPIVKVVERTMVTEKTAVVLEKGFGPMCDADRTSDLLLCYELFDRVGKTNEMRAALVKYVKSVGSKIVMDPVKDTEMIKLLLNLKERLDIMLASSFHSNERFMNAVKGAFEHFVNARENKPAELLAKFVDGVLRSGNKKYTEEGLESILDQSLTLFRFLNGKDMFEGFYKECLCKRLLLDKSASIDLEKLMISKLKQECGSQFTLKLEEMFKDIDSSKDLMVAFQQHAKSMSAIRRRVDLTVQVLQASRWPLTEQSKGLKLPQEIIEYHEVFKEFYLAKHKGRKLRWLHLNGRCHLVARFPKGRKQLQLSLHQAIVLLLFNDTEELSYREIEDATGMERKELDRTMLTLACGKTKVLRKRSKEPTISKTDSFYFNRNFQHKNLRIKISTVLMKETKESNMATKKKVFQERKSQIEASIVRIMKTRKSLMHVALINELFGQLRFSASSSDLKRSIESLIEREYLERDSSNPQLYKYLA